MTVSRVHLAVRYGLGVAGGPFTFRAYTIQCLWIPQSLVLMRSAGPCKKNRAIRLATKLYPYRRCCGCVHSCVNIAHTMMFMLLVRMMLCSSFVLMRNNPLRKRAVLLLCVVCNFVNLTEDWPRFGSFRLTRPLPHKYVYKVIYLIKARRLYPLTCSSV